MKRALVLPLICAAAQATLVPALSLEELANQSEIIAHGRVTSSWAAWDSGNKYIWTHYRMEVLDPIRGSPGASVVASEPGGSLDGVTMRISGAPDYATGEELIVFLYRTPIGYLRATGYGQGKYTVTAQRRMRASLNGFELLKRDSHGVEIGRASCRERV